MQWRGPKTYAFISFTANLPLGQESIKENGEESHRGIGEKSRKWGILETQEKRVFLKEHEKLC